MYHSSNLFFGLYIAAEEEDLRWHKSCDNAVGRAPPHPHAPRSEHKFRMVHAIIVVKFHFLMPDFILGCSRTQES